MDPPGDLGAVGGKDRPGGGLLPAWTAPRAVPLPAPGLDGLSSTVPPPLLPPALQSSLHHGVLPLDVAAASFVSFGA